MTTSPATATTTARAFRRSCAITIAVRATPDRIWALLTDAAGFPRWNSTVTSIDGPIAAGARLAVRVPAAPTRVFKPRVTRFEPGRAMVWRDGFAPMFQGVRTFTLTPRPDGTTEFAMVEVFSGALLPLITGALPDFAPSFAAYAADLKRAAEQEAA
jgi:hypothetical protein